MKKVMILMFLAFAGLTTFAQRPDNNATPEQRAERQTTRLTESLKLTEDQKKQVYALNLDRAKEMDALRGAENPDREKMRASMDKFNTDLAKVLTPEQQEKYKELAAEMRNRGGGGGGRPQN